MNKAFSETSLQQFSKQFSKFLAKTVFPLLFRCSFFIPKWLSLIFPLSIKPISFCLLKLRSLTWKSVLDSLMFRLSFRRTMLKKAILVAGKVSLILLTIFWHYLVNRYCYNGWNSIATAVYALLIFTTWQDIHQKKIEQNKYIKQNSNVKIFKNSKNIGEVHFLNKKNYISCCWSICNLPMIEDRSVHIMLWAGCNLQWC